MLEVGLRQQLLTITALTDIIDERLYAVTAPEDLSQYPCLTFMQASYTDDYTSDGSVGFATVRIVLDLYSLTRADTVNAREAIRAAMTGFRGQFPDGTTVFLVQVANSQDFYETDSRLYRSSIHLLIQYNEF